MSYGGEAIWIFISIIFITPISYFRWAVLPKVGHSLCSNTKLVDGPARTRWGDGTVGTTGSTPCWPSAPLDFNGTAVSDPIWLVEKRTQRVKYMVGMWSKNGMDSAIL